MIQMNRNPLVELKKYSHTSQKNCFIDTSKITQNDANKENIDNGSARKRRILNNKKSTNADYTSISNDNNTQEIFKEKSLQERIRLGKLSSYNMLFKELIEFNNENPSKLFSKCYTRQITDVSFDNDYLKLNILNCPLTSLGDTISDTRKIIPLTELPIYQDSLLNWKKKYSTK